MLKKLLFFAVLISLFFFTSFNKVASQEPPTNDSGPDFDQVYAEYINKYEEYNIAHNDFSLKRAQFIKFQSLKSRQDAYEATLLMLQKRDDVVVSYLEVLRIRIEEGIGVQDARREGLIFRIDEEMAWYIVHKASLSTTGSLDDLVADSEIAAERWPMIDFLAYEIMSVLSQGKITDFTRRTEEIYKISKNKLEIIREDKREGYSFGISKFQVLDRWMFESESKIVRSREKYDAADLLINDIAKNKRNLSVYYNFIVSGLTESQLYLKEANLFMKEVIRQIKTEE